MLLVGNAAIEERSPERAPPEGRARDRSRGSRRN